MARPARFERATFRLGGERSILLSYGRICGFIVTKKRESVNRKRQVFWLAGHILVNSEPEGRIVMDIDDMIFAEEESQISQR